jgi:prepilin-type N-terminal cleavage/methylation domain-containing protein
MLKSIKKDRGGFTIIEVLIVLAIAALILVIVFLAVPSLQRSARNTQRRTDVSALVTAVSNYISDNNGQVPDTIAIAGNTATVSCQAVASGDVTGCTKNGNTETATMGYYAKGSILFGSTTTYAFPTAATATSVGLNSTSMMYYPDASCNDGTPASNTGAFAFFYMPEGASGNTSVVCLD